MSVLARVLVVEDEPGARHSLEERLRAAGFEVETAAAGDEGARLASPGRSSASTSRPSRPGSIQSRMMQSNVTLGGVGYMLKDEG